MGRWGPIVLQEKKVDAKKKMLMLKALKLLKSMRSSDTDLISIPQAVSMVLLPLSLFALGLTLLSLVHALYRLLPACTMCVPCPVAAGLRWSRGSRYAAGVWIPFIGTFAS